MNDTDLLKLGSEVMGEWEKRVHALISAYRKLEEEAMQKGTEIDKAKLLEQAKKEAFN